jgi:ABC-type transporter Mla subunit MlaD
VKNFVEKVEKKFENNTDRVRAIQATIGKLESLANTNDKYKPLISYITNLLKIQIEKYDNSFDEIEKILNDL